MKFNWGTGAFALFTGFVLFMIVMVFLASSQSHELVTENYYEKELAFKAILEQKARTKKLNSTTKVAISNKQLSIELPTGNVASEGQIILFKPSAERDDRVLTFKGNQQELNFDLSNMTKGMYKMKLAWEAEGVAYYHEQKIDL